MNHTRKGVGILVGGGPAPGINIVIGAATIRSTTPMIGKALEAAQRMKLELVPKGVLDAS